MSDFYGNPLADLDDEQVDYFNTMRRGEVRSISRRYGDIDAERDLALADAMNDIEDDYARSQG